MIASLNGKLISKDENTAIVECGGVGYKCFVTKNTLDKAIHIPTTNIPTLVLLTLFFFFLLLEAYLFL